MPESISCVVSHCSDVLNYSQTRTAVVGTFLCNERLGLEIEHLEGLEDRCATYGCQNMTNWSANWSLKNLIYHCSIALTDKFQPPMVKDKHNWL